MPAARRPMKSVSASSQAQGQAAVSPLRGEQGPVLSAPEGASQWHVPRRAWALRRRARGSCPAPKDKCGRSCGLPVTKREGGAGDLRTGPGAA